MVVKDKDKSKQTNTISMGISLPRWMFDEIERLRGDVSRSLFVRRSLEEYLSKKKVTAFFEAKNRA